MPTNTTAPSPVAAEPKPGPTRTRDEPPPRQRIGGGDQHADDALAHEEAGGDQHPLAPGSGADLLGLGGPAQAALREPSDHAADRDRHHHFEGQVDPDAHRQGREGVAAPAQGRLDGHEDRPEAGADQHHGPGQFTVDDATGDLRHQGRLGGGQGGGGVHAGPGQGAGEAVGVMEEGQQGGDDQGADRDAGHQGDLLAPRRGIDELPGLQVLEVVVGDGGGGDDHRGQEQREADHEAVAIRTGLAADDEGDQQCGEQGGEDADAGDRATRRTEEPGEVAAGRRHQESEQHREQRRDRDHDDVETAEIRARGEDPEQPREQEGQGEGRARHPGDRDVALLAGDLGAPAAPARGGEGGADAAADRPGETRHRPQGTHRDDARPDQPDLPGPDLQHHGVGRSPRRRPAAR